jgi:membrane-associated phospholipid phosphatase
MFRIRRLPRSVVLTALLALWPATASAQVGPDRWTPPLPTAAERRAADAASWAAVSLVVFLDARESWRAPDRAHALRMQAARIGVTVGVAELVKRLVHRHRPCAPSCGRDAADQSFYSLHTALAFQSLGGSAASVSVSFAVGTGGLRVAAAKHWLTDVLAGAGAGLAASRLR